jgi:ribosomal protein L29/30S ribosomal protein S17
MDELLTKRRDLRQESLHLRLQQQSGQLEQPSRLRLLRRDSPELRQSYRSAEKKLRGNRSWPSKNLHHRHQRRLSRRLVPAQDAHRRGGFQHMNKTIVVRTVTRVPHPKFGKIVKQMKKFYAHDEQNQAKPGDTVRIMETRPMSKLKRWRLVEVVQK